MLESTMAALGASSRTLPPESQSTAGAEEAFVMFEWEAKAIAASRRARSMGTHAGSTSAGSTQHRETQANVTP